MEEYPAGPGQLVVVYEGPDDGAGVAPGSIAAEIAADANRRASAGWRLVSSSVFPLRQTGTAGNLLFQTGGQYATQLAAIVLYGKVGFDPG